MRALAARSDIGWLVAAAIAALAAMHTIFDWVTIIASGAPTGYGEGAVAHAGQILARGGDPYGPEPAGAFVSANYPPLAYAVEALGAALGPFTALRVTNVTACVAIATMAAVRARRSPFAAIAIGGSFLAFFPVALWGGSARVDPLAVALTAFSVVAASIDPRRAAIAGVLGALALAAKPTAALPLVTVLAYLAWRERPIAIRFGAGLAVASLLVAAVTLLRFDAADLWRHLVVYNSFGYDARNPLFLTLLAVLLMGAYVGVAMYVADGRMRAYLIGATLVILLGGHEGATVNYLFDLAAACCVALAPMATRPPGRVPALFAAQLVATLFLLTLGPLAPPDLTVHAARVETGRTLPAGPIYAEDSGVLIASGVEPVIDDPYVWARLVAIGVRSDEVTPRVRAADFAAVVSDVPLDLLEGAQLFEQERWPAELVAAVLDRYRLERRAGTLWIYVPR
jgi:hypothetical protein